MWPTNSSIVHADTGDSFRYNYSTAFTADGARDIVSEFVEGEAWRCSTKCSPTLSL